MKKYGWRVGKHGEWQVSIHLDDRNKKDTINRGLEYLKEEEELFIGKILEGHWPIGSPIDAERVIEEASLLLIETGYAIGDDLAILCEDNDVIKLQKELDKVWSKWIKNIPTSALEAVNIEKIK